MSINSRIWVVIANGGQAEIVQYRGPREALTTVPKGHFEQPNLPTRELMSDDRGRGFTGRGVTSARTAMDWHTDAHQLEEVRFVSRVCDFLEEHIGDFDQLVVAAAPKALGTFRQELSANVQQKICAEINKDYTNRPLRDIQPQLSEVIRANTLPQ